MLWWVHMPVFANAIFARIGCSYMRLIRDVLFWLPLGRGLILTYSMNESILRHDEKLLNSEGALVDSLYVRENIGIKTPNS